MADEAILTWNAANWITVIIMVTLGIAVVGMIAQIWKQKQASQTAA